MTSLNELILSNISEFMTSKNNCFVVYGCGILDHKKSGRSCGVMNVPYMYFSDPGSRKSLMMMNDEIVDLVFQTIMMDR